MTPTRSTRHTLGLYYERPTYALFTGSEDSVAPQTLGELPLLGDPRLMIHGLLGVFDAHVLADHLSYPDFPPVTPGLLYDVERDLGGPMELPVPSWAGLAEAWLLWGYRVKDLVPAARQG